jgi:hydrogenase nickel incorporation protein HypA/HybF
LQQAAASVAAVHELSICRSIADVVERYAASATVTVVRVQVGHFRQVVPATLEYCWGIVVADSPLSQSRLEIDHVPARMRCHACHHEAELTVPVLRCQHCDGTNTELLSGEEMMVISIDLADAAERIG